MTIKNQFVKDKFQISYIFIVIAIYGTFDLITVMTGRTMPGNSFIHTVLSTTKLTTYSTELIYQGRKMGGCLGRR